eukprot:118073-Chlamydomonas_euryale.AAC.2
MGQQLLSQYLPFWGYSGLSAVAIEIVLFFGGAARAADAASGHGRWQPGIAAPCMALPEALQMSYTPVLHMPD